MGIPAGTGPRILPTPYPNIYGMGVSDSLTFVGTTTSVSSNPLLDLMVSLV